MNQRLSFLASESTTWVITLGLGVLIAAGLIIWLYATERRLVSRRAGLALMGCRLAVLAVIYLMSLQPAWIWEISNEHQNRVILSMDRSESMQNHDPQISEIEALHWASGMGMISSRAAEDRITELQQADPTVETDPQWETLHQTLGKRTRAELVEHLLTGHQAAFLDQLTDRMPVEFRQFGTQSVKIENRDELFADIAPEMSEGTSLQSAIEVQEGELPAAIVLFSDGRETGNNSFLDLATQYGAVGVPVYPVLVGSSFEPRDLAIRRIDHPLTVFNEDRPVVDLELSTTGLKGETVEVSILNQASQSKVQRQITIEQAQTRLSLELDPAPEGTNDYQVEVTYAGEELSKENNEQTFRIRTIDDTINTLLIDRGARWEFRFLQSALERDERVSLDTVLFKQPYLAVLPEPFFIRKLEELNKQNQKSMFSGYELIIIGDVTAAQMDESRWAELEQWVSRERGTLVCIAGKQAMPLQHQSEALKRLLPVSRSRVIQSRQLNPNIPSFQNGVSLVPTPEGRMHRLLQLTDDREQVLKLWNNLPKHQWLMASQPKPGAASLLTASSFPGVLNPESNEMTSLMTLHRYGLGRVFLLGFEGTWRWRLRSGDTLHHRFWGQLARDAVEFQASEQTDFVEFGPMQTDVFSGTAVTVQARWEAEFLQQNPDLKPEVVVTSTTNAVDFSERRFAMETDEFSPLISTVQLSDLPTGSYELELKLPEGMITAGEQIITPLYVSPRPTQENNNLSADWQALEAIAASSGGKTFYPDQLDQLLLQLVPASIQEIEIREIPLWNHWTLLVLICLLMSGEWAIRKWVGLA